MKIYSEDSKKRRMLSITLETKYKKTFIDKTNHSFILPRKSLKFS